MELETSSNSIDAYRTLAIRLYPDHRNTEDFEEFNIEPEKLEEVKRLLDSLATKHNKDTENEEEIACPYGEENCNEDDFESMCDDCKTDRADAINEARMDTYD